MTKYSELVSFIVTHVGGEKNIIAVNHCMTRLRFQLKEEALVDEKQLLENNKIATAQKSGGDYQVVVGTNVGEIYKELNPVFGVEQ